MSFDLQMTSSITKAPKGKFKKPLCFPCKLDLNQPFNQLKCEEKESDLLSYLTSTDVTTSYSISSSLSTKGSECSLSDNILSIHEEHLDNFELPGKGVLIIDALKQMADKCTNY